MRFYVVRNIELNQLVPECLLTDLLAGWLAGEVWGEKMLWVLDKKVTFRTPSCKRKSWSTSQDQIDQTLVLPAKSFSLSSSKRIFMAFLILIQDAGTWWPRTHSTLGLVHKIVRQKLTGRFFNSFLATLPSWLPSSASKLSLSPSLLHSEN